MKLRLEVEEPLSDASRRALIDELVAFQTESFGPPHFKEFGYFLRDEEGKLRAGICGRFRWGWLYVEMLWVDASLRGQGHGTELLRKAEDFARSRGGVAVQLENGSDALPFYEKQGYEVVGSMEGYPTGHSRYYLRKWLVPPRDTEAGA